VDRHRVDADVDPDQNLHVDDDPDMVPDWHRNMPILMLILPQVLRKLENQFFLSF
jgi:hypothetical protein